MCRLMSSFALSIYLLACTATMALTTVELIAQAPTTTACDAAIANPEFHFPRQMAQEDGSRAFAYGADRIPFVSKAGDRMTLTLTLNFDPGPDALIKVAALDAACTGGNSSGAVFEYSFSELSSRTLTLAYDIDTGAMTFNGEKETAVPAGTPRYLWVEAWDGEAVPARAGYSYLVDLLNTVSPDSQ